ncbi:hypothetical protein Tco_0275626, partial [Tanacetum coccineum]
KYGALIPDGMINQDVKYSQAYKTYYDFATGKDTPKKARKFKKVPDESEDKTTGTDEGTGTKPGVPDVPTYESESENESWGDSQDDESNDVDSDDDNDGDDSKNDDDGDSDADDSERTDSDSDEEV